MSISTSSKYNSSTGICAGTLSQLINDGVITFSGTGTSGNSAPTRSGNSVTVTLGTSDAVSDNHFYINVQDNSCDSLYFYKVRTKANWSIADKKNDDSWTGLGGTLAYIRQGTNITSGTYTNITSEVGDGSGSFDYTSVPAVNSWSSTPNFAMGMVDIGAGNKTLTLSDLEFELSYGLEVSWA